MAIPTDPNPHSSSDIAVVGLACRFPGGASDSNKFWELLYNKRSAFSRVPSERYNVDAFHHPVSGKLNTLSPPGAHFLDQDVSAFDAPFFNITAQEAKAMDPAARMLLEVTYEGLENAGLPVESLAGSDTSCYVGCFTRDYHEMLMRDAETAPMYSITGTGFSLFSNRVSWFYDFRGPSMTLDTACSSSLVGVHLACQGLRAGESKVAVVCGANLLLSPDLGLWLSNLHMTSKDGLSRSFAEGVTGYGRGEGIASVILKPLSDALRDGDTIRSVIRGTGVNQDGHTAGITLPNSDAQMDLINATYKAAGLDFADTSYFEAHGTGTAAGDPLELGAVAKTVSAVRESGDELYVGSVKSNVGHLEGAAGLAGLIKCILMLEHGSIAPNIHFDQPSKRIPFASWKIQVPTSVLPWPENRLQRASVNSFGYGGTNAHVILDNTEQFLSRAQITHDEVLSISSEEAEIGPQQNRLFVFSAPDEAALKRMVVLHGQHLAESQSISKDEESLYLDRLSHTLSDRRSQYGWKTYLIASTIAELSDATSTSSLRTLRSPEKSRLAFVFTGQGAQWARMGLELMAYPVFNASVTQADAYLKEALGCSWSVLEELSLEPSASRVHLAMVSQPVCTVLQIALVQLLKSWNIEATGVIGHSSGEIAAAYCYGALTREDAWTIAYWRGKICSELRTEAPEVKGAMMATGLSREKAEEYIKPITAGKVVVACVNSPSSVTISGDESGIDELQVKLASDSVFCRKLKVENAYHSHHMELVADKYLERISHIQPMQSASTSVKMASSVTGDVIPHAELGPKYWVRNFVSAVLFSDATGALMKDDSRRRRRGRIGESAFDLLLEVGPHGALRGPVWQIMQHNEFKDVVYQSILARGENDAKSAVTAAGELLLHGVRVNVSAVNLLRWKPKPLIDLPSYPWNHSLSFWAEPRISKNYHHRKHGRHDLLGAPVADFNEQDPRWRNFVRISEQPWVRDHVVHSSILYPGSGTIAMVLEAARKMADPEKTTEKIELQDVRITKAIIIPDDQYGVETVLQFRQQRSRPNNVWTGRWEWSVYSCAENGTLEENSAGTVSIHYASNSTKTWSKGSAIASEAVKEQYLAAKAACKRQIEPKDFYEATRKAGFKYGQYFQGLQQISAGEDNCCSTIKIPDTQSCMPGNVESHHLIHPSTLDVIFHSIFAALGDESLNFKNAAVPIAFDRLVFSVDLPAGPDSQFIGFSHVARDGSRDLLADIYMSDSAWEEPKVQVTGMRCRELPSSEAAASNDLKAPLGTLEWKPDIESLHETSLKSYLLQELAKPSASELANGELLTNGHAAAKVLERSLCALADLVAHKNPNLSVLQIGGTEALTQDLLSVLGTPALRFSNYTVAHLDVEWIARVEEVFQESRVPVDFKLFEIASADETFDSESFDLVITGNDVSETDHKQSVISVVQRVLKKGGVALLSDAKGNSSSLSWKENMGVDNRSLSFVAELAPGRTSDAITLSLASKPRAQSEVPAETFYILEPTNPSQRVQQASQILVATLESQKIKANVIPWTTELADLKGKSMISLVELENSIWTGFSPEEFDHLKGLVLQSGRLLWVSMGDDTVMQVAVGYLRVLQNENPNLDLRYLHLEQNADLQSTAEAVSKIAAAPTSDREYVEMDGVLCINRWVPRNDLAGLIAPSNDIEGREHVKLGEAPSGLKLIQPTGSSKSFFFDFDHDIVGELGADEVEIEVKAIAVNHHDALHSKQDIETPLKEFSGVVTNVGKGCEKLKVGSSRVCAVGAGPYKSVFRVSEAMCVSIPDNAAFEEAASWPLSFATAYHAVHGVGRVQSGNSILVQAAATSVGQAAIQLAQLQGATVIATVSTAEESHVVESLGVDSRHLLRDGDYSLPEAISRLTNTKGPDVILNMSLTGESLLQLWHSIGARGVLIDTVVSDDAAGSSFLDMGPFRRGASYSVLDMPSIVQSDPSIMKETLQKLSEIVSGQTLKPLRALTVLPSTNVAEAFEKAQAQPSLGRVVMTLSPEDDISVPASVVSPLSLDRNATYLLIGGLGGLGRSLARLLVSNGAQHIAFISRSGNASALAPPLKKELSEKGANVQIYACDVSDEQGMKRVLDQCAAEMPPIRGVVQSAVVLNDALFDNMSLEQWNNGIRPKVQGTQLLHDLLPKNLEFFVMLSSIAGVIGNRGQANYSSGNTFQDGMAAYRRHQGLSAVSVDLGLMLGIGLIAERGGHSNLQSWEAVGINEPQFHSIMIAAMAGSFKRSTIPSQIISGLPTAGIVHRQRLEKPFYIDNPRFAILNKLDLEGIESNEETTESLSFLLGQCKSLQDASEVTTAALCERLARGLQTAVGNIDASKPLHAYGVDSLMAVDIRAWALTEAQAEIALFDVLSGISIAGLARKIAAISKAVTEGLE
ncbi:polyketide synthase [Penicillium alfredii]|uniref:Polyketide synthase n=1 Tax=Penicillium alfredii TaxID=1506179 RepID=A0A9W9F1M6_9EURO|nr:polyketide synthase [Penicillium alfredii]KAJ5091914.1 polyketide synthase [Penicillium alfredii]